MEIIVRKVHNIDTKEKWTDLLTKVLVSNLSLKFDHVWNDKQVIILFYFLRS